MDRRLLIIVNALAIVIVAWLAVTVLTNLREPVVAPGVLQPFVPGVLLIIVIILIALGYIDTRERLLDIAFTGKRPADGDLVRFLRLLLKVVNVMTALLAVLIWTFAWFYVRDQLFWTVIDTGFLAAPVICLNLLLFFRDFAVVLGTPG